MSNCSCLSPAWPLSVFLWFIICLLLHFTGKNLTLDTCSPCIKPEFWTTTSRAQTKVYTLSECFIMRKEKYSISLTWYLKIWCFFLFLAKKTKHVLLVVWFGLARFVAFKRSCTTFFYFALVYINFIFFYFHLEKQINCNFLLWIFRRYIFSIFCYTQSDAIETL